MSVGKLATILSLDATGWTKGLDGAAQDVDKFGASVRKKFRGMQDGIAEQKLATTPFNIRKQAGLDLAAAATGQKYTEALATEKVKQLGGGSVGGLLKGITTGGGEFAGLLKQSGGGNFLTGVGQALGGKGGVSGAVGSVATMLGALATPIGAVIAAAVALPLAFKALGDSVASFVRSYDPATAERWDMVMADTTAAIGRQLVPALEILTSAARFAADILANMPDPRKKSWFDSGFARAGAAFGSGTNVSSVGMAAKTASIMTDVGELGRRNLISAYETAANPQEKANELLGSIAAATAETAKELQRQRPDAGQAALRGA